MATQYHLTPEGPRKCSVDPSKPNSRGCKYDSMHFDSFDDAMEVYEDNLKATFGEFSVLVRPSAKERARRVGYRSLDGIEKVKANPQVTATVNSLKTLKTKAREAVVEIRGHYRNEESNPERAASLPQTVATEPLLTVESPEDREAAAHTEELVSSAKRESLAEYGARKRAETSARSYARLPLEGSAREEAKKVIERAKLSVQPTSPKPSISRKIRAYRSSVKRNVTLAKIRAREAVRSGATNARTRLVDSGYAVRASASLAGDTAKLRAQNTVARSRAAAQSVKKHAALMTVPAAHIRPGDTFDGATVRGVESLDNGKLKIRFQVKQGGPVLMTTVDPNRSMRIDRKTRREARSSRVASRLAKPVSFTQSLASRMSKASSEQVATFGTLIGRDNRIDAVASSIRQYERRQEQAVFINRLRALRTAPAESPVLQNS